MGQLGLLELNGQNKSPLPRCLPGLNHIVVRSLSCGAYHTALLDEHGIAFTFGSNEKGQLGIGSLPLSVSEKIIREPQRIELQCSSKRFDRDSQIRQCCCGFDFTILLSCDGTVLCFGNGDSGQLGLGYNARENQPRSSASPKRVSSLNHAKISLVAVGDSHSLFLSAEGRVFSCGKHTFGRLGLGEVDASINQKILACTPRKVSFTVQCEDGTDAASQVIGAVYAGAAASFAISSSGNVFAWGSNRYGALGLGHNSDVFVPTTISAFDEIELRTIAVGSDHCCFLSWNGNLYVAGSGRKGRLGLPRASLSNAMTSDEDPNNMALNEPFLLEYFPSVSCSVDFIAVGGAHSFALCLDEGIKTGGEMRGIPSDSRSIAIGDGITDPEAQKDAVHGPLKTGTWHEFRVQTRDILEKIAEPAAIL